MKTKQIVMVVLVMCSVAAFGMGHWNRGSTKPGSRVILRW